MIIEITKLRKLPWEFEISVPRDEIGIEPDDAELKSDARISGILSRRGDIVDVVGNLSADAVICCTRCLEPLERVLEIEFADSFGTAESFDASGEAQLDAAELGLSLFDGNEIDVSAVAREQILLNLPEQVFCREDCRGLCPTCGVNLNRRSCECVGEETDPRWAALKSLK